MQRCLIMSVSSSVRVCVCVCVCVCVHTRRQPHPRYGELHRLSVLRLRSVRDKEPRCVPDERSRGRAQHSKVSQSALHWLPQLMRTGTGTRANTHTHTHTVTYAHTPSQLASLLCSLLANTHTRAQASKGVTRTPIQTICTAHADLCVCVVLCVCVCACRWVISV